MLPLLSIIVLLLTAGLMPLIRLVRPKFAYQWLVAAGGASVAWILMLVSGLDLPDVFNLSFVHLSLQSDTISWPYAAALTTLALAVILTAVARIQKREWRSWSSTLLVSGLGTTAVLAGSPTSLLIAWTALDLAELVVLLSYITDSANRQRIITGFLPRAGGTLLLIWAAALRGPAMSDSPFEGLDATVLIIMILAAGLRLGVLPLHTAYLQEIPLRRGLGTSLRMSTAAGSLMLLARLEAANPQASYGIYLLALAGLAALFGAWAFATIEDELAGRPFWILGVSGLAVAAALRGQPPAALAWGLACILSGGILFLSSDRSRSTRAIGFFGLAGLTALPFSPAWNGAQLYAFGQNEALTTGSLIGNILMTSIFLIAQALLIAGYARHILRPGGALEGAERWVRVLYPAGLLSLPIVHWISGARTLVLVPEPGVFGWAGGAVALLAAVLLWVFSLRQPRIPAPLIAILRQIFSLTWFYRLFWWLYRALGRAVVMLTGILEGEGGILWALVLLALLLTLIAQQNPGG